MLQRLFKGLTGAEPQEQLPTFLSFLALLFLLLSYYLVKPLRDSLFLSYFVSQDLAWFSVPIIVLSLTLAKTFNHFVGRIPRYRLMVITYGLMMAFKVIFALLLPVSGRWGTVVFYLWVSIYFTLVLSILWGVINTIFSARQAERCFGFVALGATLGTIVGGTLSGWLAQSAYKDWALLFSVLSMAIALGTILLAVRTTQQLKAASAKAGTDTLHVSRGWQDILALGQNRYVRGIAMMVYALALVSMAIQFQAYGQIDRNTAIQAYKQEFGWFDSEEQHFKTIYGLKKLDKKPQDKALQQLAEQTRLSPEQSAKLKASYASYRKLFESNTRKVFSDISAAQGVLGCFLLMVVARILFRRVGLRWTVLILPGFYFLAGLALMFPLEIIVIQCLLVVANALNYSLNNATKELLYTPTSEAVRFQFKPLIEGPVMRLGDVTASVLQLVAITTIALWLGLSDMAQGSLLLGVALLFVLIWILLIWQTGKRYDSAQQSEPPLKDLDLHA